MIHDPADRFIYEGYDLDPDRGRLTCHYAVGGHRFTEMVTFAPGGDWASPAVAAAARLVFLLAGVSYFKTSAPGTVDLGPLAVTTAERAFLARYLRAGLGEFAYTNDLDLSELRIVGPEFEAPEPTVTRPGPMPVTPSAAAPVLRPLVPFGGGIDSIVTVEAVRQRAPGASLFVVNRPGDRFAAIEEPAGVTGLPIVRAEREIDPQLLRSTELGFLNGHVPVTGILSAIAVMAAALGGHDAVVMSNEWSASVGNLVVDGETVNHQWSKSLEFEEGFAGLLAEGSLEPLAYFSFLRARSELWVAERFAALPQYHASFRSCNRAFLIDPAARLDHWCGVCDKCCFIDLILAPFLGPEALDRIFAGREPLAQPDLAGRFATLLGLAPDAKPFECVGDVGECRTALTLAAARPDRHANRLLGELAAALAATGDDLDGPDRLLQPMGPDFVPAAYRTDGPELAGRPRDAAPHDQLV